MRHRRSSYIAFAAIGFGLFTFVADNGSLIIALPSIADHFGSDLPTTQWALVGYVLAISVSLLPMGRLADLIGLKPVYIAGFAVFVISGVIAGFAPSMAVLIGACVLHGLGAGMTQGTSMAMSIAAFPVSERGRVLGLYMGVVGIGSVFGPAAGGIVIDLFGWRWVFLGGALLGAVAALATVVSVPARRRETAARGRSARFDGLGALLSASALAVFLQAMTWAPEMGYGSPYIVLAFVCAAALLGGFVVREMRFASPLLDLRLFRNRDFRIGILSAFIHFAGTTSAWFLMPFYLQVALGYSPGKVGLISALSYVAMAVVGPISGRFSDRFGRRVFTVGGLLITTAGILTLSTLGRDSSIIVAMLGMILQSIGIGAFVPPNNGLVLGAVSSEKHAVISGFLNLVRNSSNVTSVAVATAIVTATMAAQGYPPTLAAVTEGESAGLIGSFLLGLRYVYLSMAALLIIGIAYTATARVGDASTANSG